MMALLPTTQTKTNRTRAPQLLYYTAAILGAFPLRAEEDRNVAPIDRQMPFRGLAHTKWMYAPRRCALLAKKLINMRNIRWLLSRKQTNIRKVIGGDEKWLNFYKNGANNCRRVRLDEKQRTTESDVPSAKTIPSVVGTQELAPKWDWMRRVGVGQRETGIFGGRRWDAVSSELISCLLSTPTRPINFEFVHSEQAGTSFVCGWPQKLVNEDGPECERVWKGGSSIILSV